MHQIMIVLSDGHYKTGTQLNETNWLLEFIGPSESQTFNAKGIWRQRYELSKQLQDLYIDVTLLSETMRDSSCQITIFIGLTSF
jgi:hypothetical protein